jgi:hypothetical protein
MRRDADLVRQLFVSPQLEYTEQELMRVTGLSVEELQDAIVNDEVEPRMRRGKRIFSSNDVKVLLLLRYSPAMLARLLPPSSVPPLNALQEGRMELPTHQWTVLSEVAAMQSKAGRPVRESDIVERLIHEWMCGLAELPRIAEAVPGLVEAMEWPLASED